jgi:hypothetical protein
MADALPQDLAATVKRALGKCPVFAVRQLDVQTQDGALVIVGNVRTYYHKQMAQEVVRSVMRDAVGHARILNRVEVVDTDTPHPAPELEESGLYTRPPKDR